METYQTEEQQVEAIKAFWSKHGNGIITGIVLGIAGYVGFGYYQDSKLAEERALSEKYEEIAKLASLDKSTFAAQSEAFIASNPKSSYAILSAFTIAQQAIEAKDFSGAEKQLQQAVSIAPTAELKALASTRLARVYIQLGNYEQALKTVESPQPEAFKAMVEEIKGDAYLLQGETDLARAAYQAAADADGTGFSPSLQQKLDDLAQTVKLTQ